MKELSSITACFIDHQGLYQPLAEKLSQSYGRLIYHDPCEEAFPTIDRAAIGDSHPRNPRIEVTDDFWKFRHDIDIFVMPDSRGAGLQEHLKEQGYPVWGSHQSITMEHSRGKFLDILKQLGFDIPKWRKVIGIDELRELLQDKEDKFIKVSKYRGTMETKHWRSMDEDEAWLDWMAVRLGGLKRLLPFYVFDKVETDLEIGGDTYRVGGWPSIMLDGYEWKDKGYFAAVKEREKMPEQTQRVLEAFGPLLDEDGHANFWSMEIRVKDKKSFFLDPTPRGPIPGGSSQLEVYSNLPEIIAAGAHGILIDPVPAAKYSIECALSTSTKKGVPDSVRIPKELQRWVKLSGCYYVDGRAWFPPVDDSDGIGWIVALGNTPQEAIDVQLEQVAMLPDGVTAATESLVELLKEIQSAEEQGIEFSERHEIPEPETVVTNGD